MVDKKGSPAVNPLVKEFLQTEGRIVQLKGYIGPSDNGQLRIYMDLGLRKYLEIAEDDVVRVIYASEKAEDPCKILFSSTAELKYVTEVTLTGADVITAALSRCSGCGSGKTGRRQTVSARPLDDGPELPEYNCELNCEVARIGCELGSRDPFECAIGYYLCRLDCIFGSGSTGSGPVVIK